MKSKSVKHADGIPECCGLDYSGVPFSLISSHLALHNINPGHKLKF